MSSRREPVRRTAMGAALAGALSGANVAYRARHIAPYCPVLERVNIPLPSGRAVPRLFRIGFVTDTHIGPVMRPADVDRALALLMDAKPDLLLFGGDYVCDSPRHIADTAAVLGSCVPSVPHGALAVLGNHDYANGTIRLMTSFERQGIQVLRNQSSRVVTGCGDFWVAGIDDALLGNPDPLLAFAEIPAGAAALALWHEPDWAEHVAPLGAFLQVSGHSHGGQIRLPWLGAVAAPGGGRHFVAGLQHASGMPIYTSRGVGIWRPPVRFRCPPEVTLFTLK